MIDIFVNMVLESNPLDKGEESKKIRIIWLNEDATFAYIIELNGECPMPKGVIVSKLKEEIDGGYWTETYDPYLVAVSEDLISEKYKTIRDDNWKIIDYLWNDSNKDILFKERRMQCVMEAAQRFNTYEKKILRLISRFWQRGMNKNALLPDYEKSAAKGVPKPDHGIKKGRPRKISSIGDVPAGINVNDDIKAKIKMSAELFYKKKKSVKEVYNCMLERFFSDVCFLDGKEVIRVWDKDRIITERQFKYWFNKEIGTKKSYIIKNNEREFLLKYRELLGNATIETFGPGSRYEIDATPADVYLVSSVNSNKIIGRPVVYAVIDVYSRLIVGIYVGLEGPSWVGAMMALDNVVTDKVSFCEKYDIKINAEDWPNSYLPETILADRGEFEGYNPEGLINNLNIKIENTAPYRGDLKGIVERRFRIINDKIKHTTPGAIMKEYRQRCEADPRLKATLNLKEFTAIIIYQVIHHNKHLLENYPRELGLLSDEILPIPLEIWKWGIKNRRCAFVKRDTDIVRLNILPRATASMSREGIKYKKMFYSYKEALEEQWFINPGRKPVNLVYDPRNIEYIYLPGERGKTFLKCFLLDKSSMYKDFMLEEVAFQQELENEQFEDNRQNQLQNDVELEHNIKNIISKAEQRIETQVHGTNRSRLKNIKANRLEEKEANRKNEYFELDKKDKNADAPIIDIFDIENTKTSNLDKPTSSKLELLKKIRDEKLGK